MTLRFAIVRTATGITSEQIFRAPRAWMLYHKPRDHRRRWRSVSWDTLLSLCSGLRYSTVSTEIRHIGRISPVNFFLQLFPRTNSRFAAFRECVLSFAGALDISIDNCRSICKEWQIKRLKIKVPFARFRYFFLPVYFFPNQRMW